MNGAGCERIVEVVIYIFCLQVALLTAEEQEDQVHCRAETSSPWHFGIYTVASNVSSAMYFMSEFLSWRYQQPDLATAAPTLQVLKYCDVNLQDWMEACGLKVEMTQLEPDLQKALECVGPSYAGHLKVCAQFVSSREVIVTLHGSSYYLKDEFAQWQGFYVTRSGGGTEGEWCIVCPQISAIVGGAWIRCGAEAIEGDLCEGSRGDIGGERCSPSHDNV